MTKLQELKAAWAATHAVAYDAAHDAREAYYTELRKSQKDRTHE